MHIGTLESGTETSPTPPGVDGSERYYEAEGAVTYGVEVEAECLGSNSLGMNVDQSSVFLRHGHQDGKLIIILSSVDNLLS